jgi:meso-butanediol dehydrogenase/(S,S)-butanediol dehydrogenase/diacetyl reductase
LNERYVRLMGRLDGKIAFITGTGNGMGRASAKLFAAEGALVVGVDMDAEAAAETERLVREAGGEMRSFHPVDLSNTEALERWIEEAVGIYGGVDILYNNAGITRPAPIEEMSVELWDYSVHNELDLVFHAIRFAWPHFKSRGGGSIINTASIVARAAFPESGVAHHATKGGVLAMTRALAVEGGPHGIRVNAISPGIIATQKITHLLDDPEYRERVLSRNVIQRMGQPEDVAWAALFLASEESGFVTGADIVIDGGVTIQNP